VRLLCCYGTCIESECRAGVKSAVGQETMCSLAAHNSYDETSIKKMKKSWTKTSNRNNEDVIHVRPIHYFTVKMSIKPAIETMLSPGRDIQVSLPHISVNGRLVSSP